MAIDFPTHDDFPQYGNQIPIGYEWEGWIWNRDKGAWERACHTCDELEKSYDEKSFLNSTPANNTGDLVYYSSGFYFYGDFTNVIGPGETFQVDGDEYTIQAVSLETNQSAGTWTKVDVTPDPTTTLKSGGPFVVTGFCDTDEDLDDLYLKRHGDSVQDTDGNAQDYYWKDGVNFRPGDGTEAVIDRSYLMVKPDSFQLRHGTGPVDIDAIQDTINISGELGTNVKAKDGDVKLESRNAAEIVERTIDDTDVPKQITNKEYVDEKDAFLQGEIIELEEEIEAIAITSERGEWISATTVNPGEFRMINLMGQTTQDYTDETINSIFFNNNDANDPSVEHGWADVEVGNILELLDKPDSDYAIYEITGKTLGPTSVGFDVAFIKGVGEATLGDRTRIKIFAKPTGGSLEDYVRIAGDDMTGRLRMDTQDAEFEKITKAN